MRACNGGEIDGTRIPVPCGPSNGHNLQWDEGRGRYGRASHAHVDGYWKNTPNSRMGPNPEAFGVI